jgi:hypothetical protein
MGIHSMPSGLADVKLRRYAPPTSVLKYATGSSAWKKVPGT